MLKVCFDRETYLPVRFQFGGKTPLTMILGDYRRVGPVMIPFLLEVERWGEVVRMQIETVTLNEPLPPEALELPEEIESLAYRRLPPEIREVEEDKDRPILRHRPPPKAKAKRQGRLATCAR
jgi:hypothetical protein